MLLPASTEAVCTSRTVSLTDDALVFHSQESGHKPQVRAAGMVSWATVRVGWRRRTTQTPHTRTPRLWTALATQHERLGTEHALKHHRPLSSINLQAADFLPLKTGTRMSVPTDPPSGGAWDQRGRCFAKSHLTAATTAVTSGADQPELPRRRSDSA